MPLEFLLAVSQGCLVGLNLVEAPANFSRFLSGHAAMFVKFHGPRCLSALFVVSALAGCAPVAAGPRQEPNAPYQQGDPRDTSGMH